MHKQNKTKTKTENKHKNKNKQTNEQKITADEPASRNTQSRENERPKAHKTL